LLNISSILSVKKIKETVKRQYVIDMLIRFSYKKKNGFSVKIP